MYLFILELYNRMCGTNSLIALMCREETNKQTNKQTGKVKVLAKSNSSATATAQPSTSAAAIFSAAGSVIVTMSSRLRQNKQTCVYLVK
jgi:hypothetical protein